MEGDGGIFVNFGMVLVLGIIVIFYLYRSKWIIIIYMKIYISS